MKFWLLILILSVPALAGAQEENKIEAAISSMIDDHPVQLGPLRVRPAVSFFSGYDSNAVTSAVLIESDYFTMVTPSAEAALRLGRRGFIAIREDLNFVYYNNQEALRDLYNTTGARLVTGSRKALIEINASYLSRLSPYNGEFDQPVQQKTIVAGANLDFALRRTTDLNLLYRLADLDFEPVEELSEELPPPPDNRTYEYGGGISQQMGRLIDLDFRASAGVVKILQDVAPNTESNFWRTFGGVSFAGRKLAGRVHLGYGKTDSISQNAEDFRDFLIDADVTYKAGRRLELNGSLKRRRTVSALQPDDFLLNTEFGLHGSFPLFHRFFIDGGATFGKNDYPNQDEISKDNYRTFEGAVNFELTKHIRIRANGTYFDRDSNNLLLSKDRFTLGAGLVMEP